MRYGMPMPEDADKPDQTAGRENDDRCGKTPVETVQMPAGGEAKPGIFREERTPDPGRERKISAPEHFSDARFHDRITEIDATATVHKEMKAGLEGQTGIAAVAAVMRPANFVRQAERANHRR